MKTRVLALACLAVLAASGHAFAQGARRPLETRQSRIEAYNRELSELAGVLGSAHYLRVTCRGRSDQTWRMMMRDLIAREGGAGRTDLVAAFNAGYRDSELRFDACTAQAQQEEAELKRRGSRLAGTLAARHSN